MWVWCLSSRISTDGSTYAEGCQRIFAENRRIGTAPQEPNNVHQEVKYGTNIHPPPRARTKEKSSLSHALTYHLRFAIVFDIHTDAEKPKQLKVWEDARGKRY